MTQVLGCTKPEPHFFRSQSTIYRLAILPQLQDILSLQDIPTSFSFFSLIKPKIYVYNSEVFFFFSFKIYLFYLLLIYFEFLKNLTVIIVTPFGIFHLIQSFFLAGVLYFWKPVICFAASEDVFYVQSSKFVYLHWFLCSASWLVTLLLQIFSVFFSEENSRNIEKFRKKVGMYTLKI